MCAVCAALSQSTVPVIRLQSPLSVSRKFGEDKSDSTIACKTAARNHAECIVMQDCDVL